MNDAAFRERLVADRLLAEASARRAGSASAETGTSIERTLMEFGLVAEEDLYRALAGFLGLEFRQASGLILRLSSSLACRRSSCCGSK